MAGTPILFRTTVPTIDLVENLSPKYIVTESPQEFRVVQYPATSFSQSYINWNIIPPSPDTIFSRYIRVTLPVQITIQGHNSSGGNGINVAPQYPLRHKEPKSPTKNQNSFITVANQI